MARVWSAPGGYGKGQAGLERGLAAGATLLPAKRCAMSCVLRKILYGVKCSVHEVSLRAYCEPWQVSAVLGVQVPFLSSDSFRAGPFDGGQDSIR